MGAYGLSKYFADGGMVQGYADGGSVDSPEHVAALVHDLPDDMLQKSLMAAKVRGDQDQVEAIESEMSMRASLRNGLAGAVTNEMAQKMMAGGGIVAFAGGDSVEDKSSSYLDDFGNWVGKKAKSAGESIEQGLEIAKKTGKVLDPFSSKTKAEREKDVEELQNAARPLGVKKMTPAEAKEFEQRQGISQTKPASPTVGSQEEMIGAPSSFGPPIIDNVKPSTDAVATGLTNALKGSKNPLIDASKYVASKSGADEEDISTLAKRLFDQYQGPSKKSLEDLEAKQKANAQNPEEIKKRGLAEMLMTLGFGAAAHAATPGQVGNKGLAGVIKSFGAAGPEAAKTAIANQRAVEAAKENQNKMEVELAKYRVSLEKGDMTAATAAAGQIINARKADKHLQAQVDYWNAQLGIEQQKVAATAGAHQASIIQAYNVLANDPTNQGKSKTDLLGMASKMVQSQAPYAATDARRADNYADEKRKIFESIKIYTNLPEGNKMRIEKEAEAKKRLDELNQLYPEFGRTSGGGGGTSTAPKVPAKITRLDLP
jgi:hypothetical protein